MTNQSRPDANFRAAGTSERPPKAAVDAVPGILLANAEISGSPEQAFRALVTNEVEKWWTIPGVYILKDWNADWRPQTADS
jgi:uncharacterized protein YndB with AHSA1/START domain